MEKVRIKTLLVKKMSGTATESDLLELALLLDKFPEYKEMNEVLYLLKTNIRETPNEGEIQSHLDELWKKIAAAATVSPKKPMRLQLTKWITAAAVIIAILSTGIFLYKKAGQATSSQTAARYQTWKVPYGAACRRVSLPDGSVVKINSGSTLSYPVHFASGSRAVNLEGEAFFEVTKNPHRPFLVHAGNLTVRVLGTSFNVKAYREDQNVETTLIHGKIQIVLDNAPRQKILLSPNEKLTVSKRFGNTKEPHLPGVLPYKLQTVAGKVTDINEIAWLDRKVAFTNESFAEVAKVIERKYNVKLLFQQEQLKNELITGVFETEDLVRALQLLQMITDFDYELKGDKVMLSNRKTK